MIRCAEESESGSPRISSSARIAGALGEAVDLAVEDLSQRAADDALRLERVRDLAKLPIELDEPSGEVVEAAMRLLAELLEDERIHLPLEQLDVGRQRQHVLDRSVVEIEAEAHQPSLGRRGERALAVRRVLEQELALDDRAERSRGLAQVGVCDALLHGPDAVRRPRHTPRRTGAPEQTGAASRRGATGASGREASPSPPRVRDGWVGRRLRARRWIEPARRPDPERRVREHVEPEEKSELELDRHERR